MSKDKVLLFWDVVWCQLDTEVLGQNVDPLFGDEDIFLWYMKLCDTDVKLFSLQN
jgi:hypothetical protein